MSARSGALRRRRKPSLGTRLRIGWVFIAVFVAAIGYAGYALVTLPALRVHAIDVRIDGLTVTQGQVLAAARIDRSRNVWLLDTAAVARRIEAIPYVDAAVVRRVPPARLTIDVTEREPVACVRAGAHAGSVTIDATRRILQAGCARADAVTIALPGAAPGRPGTLAEPPGLASLLADLRALEDARIPLRSLGEDRFDQVYAVEPNGIALLFGSDADLAEKAKLVVPVLAAAPRGRAIRALDLRAPATPTIQFK